MMRFLFALLMLPLATFAVTPVKDIRLQSSADGGAVAFTNLADVVLTNGTKLSTVSAQSGATNATGGGGLSLGYDSATRTVTGSVTSVGTITNAVGTGRLSLGVSGASITGTVDVTGLATGTPIYSLSGVATGSPIYAETGVTNGVPQGQTANLQITSSNRQLYATLTGVATGTPIYSTSGLATGTPVYLELDTTALAQLSTASNALRLAVGVAATNAATAAANGASASGALRAAIGLVDTNALARDGGISNTIAGLAASYMVRASNLADVASVATARSNLGLGAAATNHQTNAIWNAAELQGVSVSTQRLTVSVLASWTGNSAAWRGIGGGVNASMVTTQIIFNVASGAIGASNLNESVSNAFQSAGAAATNNERVLVLETGKASEVSYRVTSGEVANVKASYLNTTSRTAQTVASGVTISGALRLAGNSGTGLVSTTLAIGTNTVSTTSGGNLSVGGTATGGGNTMAGITRNSGQIGSSLTMNVRDGNFQSGYNNTMAGATADGSFIAGGTQNATYTGIGGVLPASIYSISSNAYAVAGGSGAVAQHLGSFVWADRRNDGSSDATRFKSTATNQFLVRADTVAFGTNVAVNAARLTVAGDISVAATGQRLWLSTNEYLVGTGTGMILRVYLNPPSTNGL